MSTVSRAREAMRAGEPIFRPSKDVKLNGERFMMESQDEGASGQSLSNTTGLLITGGRGGSVEGHPHRRRRGVPASQGKYESSLHQKGHWANQAFRGGAPEALEVPVAKKELRVGMGHVEPKVSASESL